MNHGEEDIFLRTELEGLRQEGLINLRHVLKEPPKNWSEEKGEITGDMIRNIFSE